jgi:hypothetical protein
MVESAENKNSLADRLDQDRQRLAIEADRWKRLCDLPGQMRASTQRDPLPWMIGAIVTGFLLSLLPARREEVYAGLDSGRSKRIRKMSLPVRDEHQVGQKLWALAKPLISTYFGQLIYKRVRQLMRRAY